jgi:pimeloyl-ACP methyl ester carboxylesterase
MAQRLILVYGQQDRIVHPRSLEAIRVVLPQARFIQVPNVGHELLWTHGSLIEEICRESLRDAGKEAAPFSGGKGIQPLQSLL